MKLTKAIRAEIKDSIIKDTFDAAITELHKKQKILVDEIYDELMGGYLPSIAKLPKDLIRTPSHLMVDFGGESIDMHFNGQVEVPYDESKNSYYSNSQYYRAQYFPRDVDSKHRPWAESLNPIFSANHKATLKWRKLSDTRTTLLEARDALGAKTEGLLQSYTTVKLLRENCPELIPHIPANIGTGAAVPMIPPADLLKELKAAKERFSS